ncbi:MAG: ABC transporter permease [Actinomycetota bacterium]
MTRALGRIAPVVVALVALVVAWDLGVRLFDPEPWLVPPPGDVVDAFWRTRSVLDDHVRATMTEALLGLLLGSFAGAVLALALSLSAPVRRAVQPLLVVSQSVPMVVLAPILIVWFGFGTGPRVAVVALIAFFPVAISTLDSLLGADAELVELFRGLGAGRLTTLWRVRLPAAGPGFFAGMKVSAAYAMFGAVIAEWMGASVGLGVYLQRSQASFRTDQLFAAVIVIAAASMALFGLVSLAARLALPWRHTDEGDT